jgi:hypothetical protein
MAKELGLDTIRRWKPGADLDQLPKLTNGCPVLRCMFKELAEQRSQFGDGHVLRVTVKGEEQTWQLPALLKGRLRRTKPGTLLAIVPYGSIETPNGRAYDFKVFELATLTEELPAFDPPTDGDLPF